MFCRKCGASLVDGSRFCDKCGTEVYVEYSVQQHSSNPHTIENISSGPLSSHIKISQVQATSPTTHNANEVISTQIADASTTKSDTVANEVKITTKFGRNVKIIAAVLAVAIVLASILFGIPYTKYQKAKNLLEEGKYDQAIAEFSALGAFYDSSEMVNEPLYQKALFLFESADFKDAYVILEDLNGYKDSKAKLDKCIYSWASNSLALGSETFAKSFEQTVELSNENYATVYETIIRNINSHEDFFYWFNTQKSAVVYSLLKTLPTTYEDTSSLLKFFKALANGDSELILTYIEEKSGLLKSLWYLNFVKNCLTDDAIMPIFLEGYWTTSDNSYYLNFYEDEDEIICSEFTLPWVSQPKGTEHYDIQSSIYVWADEDFNELAKVFKITVVDFDTIKVFCYKDNKTYTLFRN